MQVCEVNADLQMETRVRRAGNTADLHITARPRTPADAETQADALMGAVAGILGEHEASIFQERVLVSEKALPTMRRARARHLAKYDDGVEPSWLSVPANECGEISGITVHAVTGYGRPEVISVDGKPCGRRLRQGQRTLVTGSGLQGDGPDAPTQARQMLAMAEILLSRAGGSLQDVVRTWMWLGHILDWYGDFNRVRSELFRARGLLRADGSGRLPASTGIGIGPSGGRHCAMDLAAEIGNGRPRLLLKAGRQDSANKYGSAFSRAAVTATPFGEKVYVSGTASIGADGQTTHVGDAAGQIAETFNCVNAVLREAGCEMDDVVQAIVYCKTPEVERVFREQWGVFPMPYVLALADVCRDNLLFEVECTAIGR